MAPVQNPYTWVNLTNMLWVEQPVGVGKSFLRFLKSPAQRSPWSLYRASLQPWW